MNNKLTQGTILYGMRSEKYHDTCCYGIIISARCDIANCKVPKIYYLTATDMIDWIYSKQGFQLLTSQRKNELENSLMDRAESNKLDWETLSSFSNEELNTVVTDSDVGIKRGAEKFISDFVKYKDYLSDDIELDKRKSILSEGKKTITDYILKIIGGQVVHYCFIPQSANKNNQCVNNGLVIDLQELEQLSLKEADLIEKGYMDKILLEPEQIENYNKRFFLDDNLGFVDIVGEIVSPWIEYLMQRFSNAFIRIGVDGPNINQIKEIVNKI